MNFTEMVENWKNELANNWTVTALKTAIVIWAIFVIILVIFFVHNPYVLAAIFLYEVLP